MHFAPVHAAHGFETMRLCEHLNAHGLGPLSHERGDLFDDYHQWLIDQGLPDPRIGGGAGRSATTVLPAEAHPTAWIDREVTAFLATRDTDRPLFLVVSFPHPHAPYDPPAPYSTMYDPDDSILPPTGHEVNERLPMVFGLATAQSPTREAATDGPAVRRMLALVRGLVRQIDDVIGRLVAQLDLASTLVFFTSDHGDYAGHRGLLQKTPWIPFDDLARVPLLAVGNGIWGGRREAALVQSSDIALTCLDYAGVTPPSGVTFDTLSLRPILDDDPSPADLERTVFSATSLHYSMARWDRYKYISHAEHGGVLFDLHDDPHEQHNRLLDPALARIRDELDGRLRAVMSQPVLDISA